MKQLTLKQLRLAIEIVSTDPKFKDQPEGTNLELLRASTYMANSVAGLNEPRDPREVLVAVGYEW